MIIVRFPSQKDPWLGRSFAQSTSFQYQEHQLTLTVFFTAPNDEPYNLRGVEKAWEAATAAAFTHRTESPERLIEKLLTAINAILRDSLIPFEGAVLLNDTKNSVHFSTNGSVVVAILSDGKISAVSTPQQPGEYSAVTSGEIDEADLLILCNKQSFEAIETGSSTSAAIEQLAVTRKELIVLAGNEIDTDPVAELLPSESRRRIDFAAITQRVTQLTRDLPRPLFKLPKLRVKRFPLRLPLILAFVVLLSGLLYGGFALRERLAVARKTETPPATLATKLLTIPATDTAQFLHQEFEYADYKNMNSDDQKSFTTTLAQRGITARTVSAAQELPERIVDISRLNDMLYIIDSTGQLWKYDQKTLQKIPQNGLIIEPKRLVALREDRILATDKSGNIWLFDTSPAQPVSLALPQSLSGEKLLASYQRNLYVYTQNTATIYRISNYDREIASPTVYARVTPLGLGTLSDLMIYGEALAIDTSGKLVTFSRNQALSQSQLAQSSPDTAPARLYETGEGFQLLVNRFIERRSSDSSLQNQIFLLTAELPSVAIYQNQQLQFIGAGKTIYRVD